MQGPETLQVGKLRDIVIIYQHKYICDSNTKWLSFSPIVINYVIFKHVCNFSPHYFRCTPVYVPLRVAKEGQANLTSAARNQVVAIKSALCSPVKLISVEGKNSECL